MMGSPKIWPDDNYFRLFISHLSSEKGNTTRLSDCLLPYYIKAFVSHKDILPTTEWQNEIERALYSMDAFLAFHTKGFSESHWTQQEIGFAVARGVKIISFEMGESPTGFISRRQALPRKNRTAEEIAREVNDILLNDDATRDRMILSAFMNATPNKETSTIDDDIPF
jgi:TIR domain